MMKTIRLIACIFCLCLLCGCGARACVSKIVEAENGTILVEAKDGI